MSKYYGKIGYVMTEETVPGVWSEKIIERNYYGDVTKNYRNMNSNNEINNGFTISNTFSILSDDFALNNLCYMKYIEYMGLKWNITSIDIQRPRLNISIGGLYNG